MVANQVFIQSIWGNGEQKGASHSSYGGEMLACPNANGRDFHLKESLSSISQKEKIRHILHVDSKGLWDTIKTRHLGREE